MATNKKWLKEITQCLASKNIKIEKIIMSKNNHLKVYIVCADGIVRFLTISKTPSDFRAIQKIKANAVKTFNTTTKR
jgi:abortive infection bacteriophage resistance protein